MTTATATATATATEAAPARGYSWPPFEPGHKLSVTHGANSESLVRPEAERLAPAVLEQNPHLDPARDGVAIARYAMTLARIGRVYAWLTAQEDAVFDDVDQGTIHGAYERLERWERQADEAETRLAIAPLTRARLGLDQLRAAALTDEDRRQQREARERLDSRAAELDGDD